MSGLSIAMATRSEAGGRDENEDALQVGQSGRTWYAVLADGAGGHARGAEAAQRSVARVAGALHRGAAHFRAELLTGAIEAAHDELQRAQPHAAAADRMHTTIVVLWIDDSGQRALWSHVGDSRLYCLRRGAVDAMTNDDSVVQRMVDVGLLSVAQARRHPHKNQLLAALGIDEPVDAHTIAAPFALADGDAFLLCSDGWWDALADADIIAALAAARSPADWLDTMKASIAQRADARQDNYSAIAVWVGERPPQTQALDDGDTTIA